MPTVRQLYELRLIFNRSFSGLFEELAQNVTPTLARRVERLPKRNPRRSISAFNRTFAIRRLHRRLHSKPADGTT